MVLTLRMKLAERFPLGLGILGKLYKMCDNVNTEMAAALLISY